MKKQSAITIFILLMLWFFLSLSIGNDILLPNPVQVIEKMINQIQSPVFYQTIFLTLIRMLKGLGFSLLLAMMIAVFQDIIPSLKDYFNPINALIKTIPNISYIIIILIWFGSEISVTIITFLILFPTFYSSLTLGFDQFNKSTIELFKMYPVTFNEKYIKIAPKIILPYLINSLKLSFGLGFKVSIMAEILGQVKGGVGRQMHFSKINLDMVSIFAWTLWIVLICGLFDFGFELIHHKKQ